MKLTPEQMVGVQSYMGETSTISNSPRDEFINILQSHDFSVPVHLKINEINRMDAINERKGKKSGWYIYNEIESTVGDGHVIGFATFGDWRTDEVHKWSSRSENQMGSKELVRYREKREQAEKQRREEEQIRHKEAAERASEIWSQLPYALDDHPYLKAKGVKATKSLKVTEHNELVIPAIIDNSISTLQYIGADGQKRFMSAGKSKGAHFPIKGEQDVIYIAEGYSTGRSISMATDKMVYVCFNCHNIYNVTAFAKEQHPEAQIIIAGDDDFNNEINSGRKYAEEAARSHGILVIFPAGLNDFNDMHVEQGLESVRQALVEGEEWHDPKEINPELLPVPSFDAKALLPPALEDWVMDTAGRMSCAPDFVAAAAIVALGSVIGASCGIKPKKFDDWTVCPNLWGMAVSPPSSKKSPAISKAFKPLDRLIAMAKKDHADQMNSFEAGRLVGAAKEKALKHKLDQEAKKPDGDMSALADQIKTLNQSASPEPILRRYKTNDATVEKFGEMLAENPRGMIMLRDELVGLLASWEKKGHERT